MSEYQTYYHNGNLGEVVSGFMYGYVGKSIALQNLVIRPAEIKPDDNGPTVTKFIKFKRNE